MPRGFKLLLPEIMAKRKITGRALSKQLRVHESSVVQWKAGDRVPSMDRFFKLMAAIDALSPKDSAPLEISDLLVRVRDEK